MTLLSLGSILLLYNNNIWSVIRPLNVLWIRQCDPLNGTTLTAERETSVQYFGNTYQSHFRLGIRLLFGQRSIQRLVEPKKLNVWHFRLGAYCSCRCVHGNPCDQLIVQCTYTFYYAILINTFFLFRIRRIRIFIFLLMPNAFCCHGWKR